MFVVSCAAHCFIQFRSATCGWAITVPAVDLPDVRVPKIAVSWQGFIGLQQPEGVLARGHRSFDINGELGPGSIAVCAGIARRLGSLSPTVLVTVRVTV